MKTMAECGFAAESAVGRGEMGRLEAGGWLAAVDGVRQRRAIVSRRVMID
jgi:hypothetical protein